MLFKPIVDVKRTVYCGPSAIALLTGVPVSRIEKMIRRCRPGWGKGRKLMIRGAYNHEVLKVLKRLGCKVEPFHKYAAGSFAKFVDDVRNAGTFLVNVTGHYMVCSGGMIGDASFHDPIPIEEYEQGKRIVKKAWRVYAPSLPKYTIDDSIQRQPAPKPKRDIKVVRAEKLKEDIKRWERKEKLAKTKLKNLRAKLKRYEKLGVIGEP